MATRVIAEGVEDRDAYEFLGNIGCDMAQGYMISRPLPVDDFATCYKKCDGRDYEANGFKRILDLRYTLKLEAQSNKLGK